MRLRNRKTGEKFVVEKIGRKFVLEKEKCQNQFFQLAVERKSMPDSKIAVDLAEAKTRFIEDLPNRFPKEMSAALKAEIITQIQTELEKKQSQQMIEDIMSDPKFIKLITQQETKHSSKSSGGNPSFTKFIGQLLATSAFPKAALLIAMAPLAGAVSGLISREGQPIGGLDLCGFLLGCFQGYLTNGTAPWTSNMPQYSSTISTFGGNSNSFKVIEGCLSISQLGDLVGKAYARGGDNITTCNMPVMDWRDYRLTALATAIPAANCDGLSDDIYELVAKCLNRADITSWSTIGVLAFCCCACCLLVALKDRCRVGRADGYEVVGEDVVELGHMDSEPHHI